MPLSFPGLRARHWLLGLTICLQAAVVNAQSLPEGVTEIPGPPVTDISGAAYLDAGRYVVVGNKWATSAMIYEDGSWQERMWVNLSERRRLRTVLDAESIDVVADDGGKLHWFVLGEDLATVYILNEAAEIFIEISLPETFREQSGHGAEGLAARFDNASGEFEIAALHEGGCIAWRRDGSCENLLPGRVAVYRWNPDSSSPRLMSEIELDVPKVTITRDGLEENHHFRSTDLVWQEDGWLVLLGSVNETGFSRKRYDHTWLQAFGPEGKRRGTAIRLEKCWPDYRRGKNWEALDWAGSDKAILLGYDHSRKRRPLSLVRLADICPEG